MKLSKTLSTKQIVWRHRNRGAVQAIMQEHGVSRTTVEKVMRFEFNSRERRIERSLAERDCPGFEAYKEQAVAAE